ncbi:hypothetical protein HDU85_006210 [Gaertneriomyces sp. JEL0708]|nr:hypothetical protein HDU85_006210 [Gaertneriomyces sp. JEL0708]
MASTTSVKADSQERLAISSGYEGKLRAWDLHNGAEMAMWGGDYDGKIARGDYMQETRNPIMDFIWAPGSESIVACTRDGRLLVFDLNSDSPAPKAVIQAHQGTVRHVVHGAHPSLIISAGNVDGAVRMFDLRLSPSKGRCVKRVETLHTGGVTNLIAHGNFLISSGSDGRLKVMDAQTLQVGQAIDVAPGLPPGAPASACYALTTCENGVLSAWGDGSLVAHNLNDGRLMSTYDGQTAGIRNALRHIAVTPNGILAAGDDGSFVKWKI